MNDAVADQLWAHTPDAVIVFDAPGMVEEWNRAAEVMFGHARADAVGRDVCALLVPVEEEAGERQAWHEAQREGMAVYESVRRTRDGALLHVSVALKARRDAAGMVRGFVACVRDVTHLKAKRDAQLVQARFGRVLESTPDAMVIVNQQGRIVLVNSQAVRLFGWNGEELLGESVELLVPERFRGRHAGHRRGFFAAPKTRAMGAGLELYGRRKDGTDFPVEISLSPLETEEGVFVSGAIRDVTERRRFEERLREANRLKSEFLATMSHELRTPLNSIIGFTELLVDGKAGPLAERQREFLNDVLQSGRHLLQLINDVLDLSKVEAGRMTCHPEPFDLAGAMAEVVTAVTPLAEQKRVTIATLAAGPGGPVTLDRPKFKQVLFNLLANALKFSHDGGRVEVRTMAAGAGRFRLAVSDHGIGIRAEDRDRLFVAFQQLDSSHARRFEGTGLGLALTKRLVELQGGTVAVESEPGKGSTFTVELPREAAPADPEKEPG